MQSQEGQGALDERAASQTVNSLQSSQDVECFSKENPPPPKKKKEKRESFDPKSEYSEEGSDRRAACWSRCWDSF